MRNDIESNANHILIRCGESLRVIKTLRIELFAHLIFNESFVAVFMWKYFRSRFELFCEAKSDEQINKHFDSAMKSTLDANITRIMNKSLRFCV